MRTRRSEAPVVVVLLVALAAVAFVVACGGDEGAASSCETSSDCSGDVCVATSGAATCAPKCSLAGDECSGEASCQGLGSVSVSVCAPKPKASSPSDPPRSDERPRAPCKTDADCAPLDPRAICAQWRGARDCTIACTSNDACAEGPVAGVEVDFESCQPDEGNAARSACLPRAECEDDPLACVTFPGSGVLVDAGGSSGFPGGSSGFPGGEDPFR
jgi:hypothetical protein